MASLYDRLLPAVLPLCRSHLYCVRDRKGDRSECGLVRAVAGCGRKATPGMEPAPMAGVGGQHGDAMTSTSAVSTATSAVSSAGGKRVLIVEDELMIRMLLEGMLTDLGHTVAAEAGGIDEALALARQVEFDVAVLDVNLNNQSIAPVVEVLIERGVPFIFASGYGQRGVPEPYRQTPTLQKPFQVEALAQAIDAVTSKAGG